MRDEINLLENRIETLTQAITDSERRAKTSTHVFYDDKYALQQAEKQEAWRNEVRECFERINELRPKPLTLQAGIESLHAQARDMRKTLYQITQRDPDNIMHEVNVEVEALIVRIGELL